MGLSVVIPSKSLSNLIPCLKALRTYQPHDANLLVVDDGLSHEEQIEVHYLQSAIVNGIQPFCFARNCNRGILACEKDDVILLNDDALLKTRDGFTATQRAAEEHPEYGIISATTNVAGNLNQLPKGIGLREEPRMVCFICVLIPRKTIDLVGLLDERFVGYGHDDDDYCVRIRRAGLKIGIFDGCFVDHGSLTSSFRGGARTPARDLSQNAKIFAEKYGADNRQV